MSEGTGSMLDALVPVRRSPLDAAHAELGARWRSPSLRWPTGYGDPTGESEAARDAAALVDWGPLDKFTVKGRRIGAALAAIGLPFRAGEITAPDGAEVEARAWGLAQDEALVLVEGGPADLAERLAGGGGSVVDVSSGFAALRIVGPRARAVLERLCPVDLASQALRDRCVTFGPVANVRVTLGREDIGADVPGFTLLVARDQARYLWDALLDHGASLGLRPAGNSVLPPASASRRS